MAELESAPSGTTTTETAAPATVVGTSALVPQACPAPSAADAQIVTGEIPVHRSKWKVPFLATLGAAFGSLIGSGLYGELFPKPDDPRPNLGEFLIIAVVIGAAAYWFFDPLMELVQGWFGVPPREIPKERRIVTTGAVVVATLLISILHHSLATSLEHVGVPAFIVLILFFACTAGITTSYWGRGARTQPPRAASYGAKSGGVAGLVASSVLVMLVLMHKNAASNQLMTASDAPYLLKSTSLWTVLTLIPGLLGGLAIEKGWDRKSPTRGILSAMAAFSGAAFLLALVVGQLFPEYNAWAWFIGLQSISLSMGWALGPFLQRESCDRYFDVSGSAETVLPNIRRPGTVVVPIDSRRPLDAPQTIIPAGFEATPVSPQVLLLQPKGSRAWALGILVLALAVGGWAYTTGAIRTDPEIVAEIVNRLRQDPNLKGKSLTASSLGHVVTVSGIVDNGTQHSAVVQQAAVVRGVKQVVDEVQLGSPSNAAKSRPSSTTINAEFSVSAPSGPALGIVARPVAHAAPLRQAPPHAVAAKPMPATQQKRGLFHWFRKGPTNNKNQNQNAH